MHSIRIKITAVTIAAILTSLLAFIGIGYLTIAEENDKTSVEKLNLLSHVCNIDQHKPFTDPAVEKIFELIEPDYVVHVLYYDDFNQLARQITEQKQLLKV